MRERRVTAPAETPLGLRVTFGDGTVPNLVASNVQAAALLDLHVHYSPSVAVVFRLFTSYSICT